MNNTIKTADKIMDTLTRVSIYVGVIAFAIFVIGSNLINNRINELVRNIIIMVGLLILYIIVKVMYSNHLMTIKDKTHKVVLKSRIGNITRHKFDNHYVYEYNGVTFMFVGDSDTNIVDEHKTINMDNGLMLGYIDDYSLVCDRHYRTDYNKVIESLKHNFNVD